MVRLRPKHLPHRVTITRFLGDGPEGDLWAVPVADVPAYVEQKAKLRVDRRATSPSAGQEITTTTFIVLLTADDVAPRSKITVWAGTPRERTSEVVDSEFYDYPRTPSHVEAFTE
ncbi:MAG: hypothetical protein U1E32_10450 [Rhodoglobus sp.]|nr:hypothetical protein [Rhodoglobus sp.]